MEHIEKNTKQYNDFIDKKIALDNAEIKLRDKVTNIQKESDKLKTEIDLLIRFYYHIIKNTT